MSSASILWRRLDGPGHDACRLERDGPGWRLEGTAVLQLDGAPARLDYEVACDGAWHSRAGAVRGWIGERSVSFRIERTSAGWALDGVLVPEVERCLDLDLSVTPATNLLQLRRLALDVGQAADAPAAWLDVAAGALRLLPQRYERRSLTSYGYESPSAPYAGVLEVTPVGFVRRYPGLWEAET